MEEHPQTKSPNPNPNNKFSKQKSEKSKNNKNVEYEFCKVCKLHHDRGQRHKYFPNHTKALSSFLSRFRSKLSDIRFFLHSPTLIRPEHASRNRFWCVFCDSDIDELNSSFACSNAISHLASSEHLKNLKGFLWKYGGGTDRVDSFRVSEADFTKWEKKCNALKGEGTSSSEGSRGVLIGPPNDIHNDFNCKIVDSFDKNITHSVESSLSNGVLPLQSYTDEYYQVSKSNISEVAKGGFVQHGITSSLLEVAPYYANSKSSKHLTDCDPVYTHTQHHLPGKDRIYSAEGILNNGGVCWDKRMANGESNAQGIIFDYIDFDSGLQTLTQISSTLLGEARGNVHSGAPPPWFEATEQKPESGVSGVFSPLSKQRKSHKLNPKRVGAAWAERRKIELEMERRGEILTNNCDDNWLPNFGRVWQSGSRKESRKEFEMEKPKLKVGGQSEMSFEVKPYISKRMRRDESE